MIMALVFRSSPSDPARLGTRPMRLWLRSIAPIILVPALAGCAGEWDRPNTSDATMLTDRVDCREKARLWKTDSIGDHPTWKIDESRFADCMTERGYTKSSP